MLQSFGGALAPADADDAEADTGGLVTPEALGRYLLQGEELGRGGIGRVLLAVDQHLNREVALKELLVAASPGTATNGSSPEGVQRFLQEARITGHLEHPGIVPVYELGRRADGSLYYTMKLVRGRTLRTAIAAAEGLQGRLQLLNHFRDLCQALAYAHSEGVVHRDLKPDNVMVGEFGETMLLDWGLAKYRERPDLARESIVQSVAGYAETSSGASDSGTIAGDALGTPAYMSPEQAEGDVDKMDERSDVWGLGAVLYELLTGRPPFEAPTPYETIGRVMVEDVEPVTDHAPDAPAELVAIAHKALTRDRGQRYPSAQALAAEVEAYLTGARVAAYDYSSWELLRRFVDRNRAVSLAAVAIWLVVLIGGALTLRAYRQADTARALEVQARTQSEARGREAQHNLGRSYLERAQALIDERRYASARVLAAAAALQSEAHPRGPYREARWTGLAGASRRAELQGAYSAAWLGQRTRLVAKHARPAGTGRVAVSPEGALGVTSAGSKTVWAWRLSDGAPLGSWPNDTQVQTLHFVDDGTVLVIGAQHSVIRTRDARTGAVKAELTLAEGGFTTKREAGQLTRYAIVSPDRRYAAVTLLSSQVLLVSLPDLQPIRTFDDAIGLGITKDSLLVGRADNLQRVRIASLRDGRLGSDREIGGDAGALSPAGDELLIGRPGAGLQRLSYPSLEPIADISLADLVTAAGYAPDGQTILALVPGGLLRIERETGAVQERFDLEGGTSMDTDGDGSRVLVRADTGTVWVLGESQTAAPRVLRGPTSPVRALACTADGATVVAGTLGGEVFTWSAKDGRPGRRFPRLPASVEDVAVGPKGAIVAAVTRDMGLHTWGPEGDLERAGVGYPRLEGGVSISKDGLRLAYTAPDDTIHILGLADGALERRMEVTSTMFLAKVRWSPTGGRLAVSSLHGQVTIHEHPQYGAIGTLAGEGVRVTGLGWSRDGRYLATSGADRTIRVWDARTGDLVRSLGDQGSIVNEVHFSPDDRTLISSDDAGRLRWWDTQTWTLVEQLDVGAPTAGLAVCGDRIAYAAAGPVHLLPATPRLWGEDPAAMLAEAERDAGESALGDTRRLVVPETRTATPTPEGQVRIVVLSGAFGRRASAEDGATEVELLDAATARPFDPPLVGTPDAQSEVHFTLPEGLARYMVRIRRRGTDTYLLAHAYNPRNRLVTAAWLSLGEVGGQPNGPISVMGLVGWGDEVRLSEGVGCARVRTQPELPLYYLSSPGCRPTPTLEHTQIGCSWVATRFPPNVPITVFGEVGDAKAEQRIPPLPAGSVLIFSLGFSVSDYPTNPTPRDCRATPLGGPK